MEAIVLAAVLYSVGVIYIRLADRGNIVDKPNLRSSHSQVTVRGGGILIPLAWFIFSVCNGFAFPWFTVGLLLIAGVSFWDDTGHVPVWLRSCVHVLALSFSFFELNLFTAVPWWVMVAMYVLCIGIVNAFNFMDGINGMTGAYSLAVLALLIGVWPVAPAVSIHNPVFVITVALLVFGFFNFRKRARCFAGDVGSVSVGFVILLFLLMLSTGMWIPGAESLAALDASRRPALHPQYLLCLAVYGVDSVLTIVHRLFLGESIFRAHRRHLYQHLSNDMRWPHLVVSSRLPDPWR